MSRRDFVKASYTGSATRGQSAARLARYIEYRQRDAEREPERERSHDYERAQTYGDRDEFVEAARERTEAGRRSSYVHVVVSPERGAEYKDRDFERLVDTWIRDRNGNELAHYAAVHRDTDHSHVHITVARDKFQKAEYATLKEQSRERMGERERIMIPEREPEMELLLQRQHEHLREQERIQGQERMPEREEPAREHNRQRERNFGKDRDEGREMER